MFNIRHRKNTSMDRPKKVILEDIYEEEYHEEEKTQKIIKIGNVMLAILILVIGIMAIDIVSVSKYNNGPFFAIPTKTYKDGGTKEYYGIGYKVIKYHQVQGRRDREVGTWGLKYNTEPITIQDLDLAIELTDSEAKANDKYHNKFVRLISTLHQVNTEDHILMMGYTDEDGKYSLDIICQVAEDQEDLSKLEENKEITIIGTIREFEKKTTKHNKRVFISDCFAEQ